MANEIGPIFYPAGAGLKVALFAGPTARDVVANAWVAVASATFANCLISTSELASGCYFASQPSGVSVATTALRYAVYLPAAVGFGDTANIVDQGTLGPGTDAVNAAQIGGQSVSLDSHNALNVNAAYLGAQAVVLDAHNALNVNTAYIGAQAVVLDSHNALSVNAAYIGAQTVVLDSHNALSVNTAYIGAQTVVLDSHNALTVNAAYLAGQAASLDSHNALNVNAAYFAGVAPALDANNLLSVNARDWNGTAIAAALPGSGTLARAGDAMDLIAAPSPTAISAIQSGLATAVEIAALPSTSAIASSILVNPAVKIDAALLDVAVSTRAPSSGGGFSGPHSITLLFHDAAGHGVGGVVFSIPGLGSAVADATGSITIALPSGSFVVLALATSGVMWSPTTIAVSADATFTFTGTSIPGVTPAAAPGKTTAFLTTRDGQGNALAGVTLTFALIDPTAATDSYDQSTFAATSDANGLLQIALMQATQYQARVGAGAWVQFTTGTGSTFALPEILGRYTL